MIFQSAVRRTLKSRFESILPSAIHIDGPNPYDPQIHDERFYEAVALGGTLGLGESYMAGQWDCAALDVFFEHLLAANLFDRFRLHPTLLSMRAKEILTNPQRRRASKVVAEHYDPGSDTILTFLDPYNQYTCGYWEDCHDLNTAQEKKLDLICRKLELKKSDRVLDIGCGWGGFAKYAAEHYGCHVTGITVSNEQVAYGQAFCRGLNVTIRNCDYRDLEGTFDKILICGMSEHVGYKNYRVLAQCVHRRLSPDGLFLWHTIGQGNRQIVAVEPWLLKYIFPNSMLPTMKGIAHATEGLFDLVDMHEFGVYYDPTLMAWRDRFVAKNSHKRGADFTESQYRMWYYYLSSCAAFFRVRRVNLWQLVFRRAGGPGYRSVR